jgi:PAS domain S-box-containing protein
VTRDASVPMVKFPAEYALESFERLGSIMDLLPVGVVLVLGEDVGTALVCDWNIACEKILGDTPRSLLAEYRFAFYPPDRSRPLPMAEWPYIRVISTGEPVREEELHLRRPDGEWRVLLSSVAPVKQGGRVVGAVVIGQDITAQKEMENKLRDREEWFRSMVDTVPHMVWVATPDGRNEYSNARLTEYRGVAAEELRGHGKWKPAVHPDDLPGAVETWSRALATGLPYTDVRRHRRHDGEYRWFQAAGAPLRDRAGRVVRWIGTWTDIHDRVQAEEALRESNRQKDQFLSALSHELRSPLAPIQNALYLLERAEPGSRQATLAREAIGRQVQHLTRLVDDLLDVTRIARGKVRLRRRRMDLAESVRRTVEDHRPTYARRRVGLELQCPSEPVWVKGDETRLSQVVSNLLQNSAKFTNEGGHVLVSLERSQDEAVLRIRDDGVGMGPGLLRVLFEPFVQADKTLARSRGGLGLGLALVKGIVQLHGGTAVASSEGEGRGSEFVVRIPLGRPAAVEHDRASPCATRKLRVLVVEDNNDAADTLEQVLDFIGHDALVARTGTEGLEMVRRLRPDVVICDIGLPGMDGYEVARAIRARQDLRQPTLIALSGYASPEDMKRTKEAGFERHLAKPLAPDELARVLAGIAGAEGVEAEHGFDSGR